MTIPTGYVFMPTDEELLVFYLGRKSNGLPLPCDTVIEREIYGDGDKAPWQVFTDEDPWKICKTKDKNGNLLKTESTIYVLTTLIKASKNRIARTAGCGAWHAETGLEHVLDDHGWVIGYKKTLCFQITNKAGVTDEDVKKSHWIMHEYSLCQGKQSSKGEYVICRIKRDDSKFTRKRIKNSMDAAIYDDVIVSKPAKRARKEFVQEQSFMTSDEPKKLTLEDLDEAFASLDEPVSVMEQQESFGLQDLDGEFASLDEPNLAMKRQESFRFEDLEESAVAYLDEPVLPLEQQEIFGFEDLDESALAFLDEPVSALEQQESFGLQNLDEAYGYLDEPGFVLE
ncbi:hypothetical protein Vadar_010320 [Vaccinium darrowii]|uniref:Uncharacterized protein n=1 Tax=Vaccinium darrowii TaxID=229202 RepID=A0ACB7XXW4_9ERIC|nr:hypothetical protein Vadar_010320 [Vaccinium darrowii]